MAASAQGDKRYNTLWADISAMAGERSHALNVQLLKDLAAIPRAELPAVEQLNYDLFEKEYRDRVAAWPFKPEYWITHLGGVQTLNETAELLSFQTVRDYEDWLTRLQGLGRHLDQYTDVLQQGLRNRQIQPRVIVERILPQIDAQIVEVSEQSPFYAPFEQFPDSVAPPERERLRARAREVISQIVVPAYRRFERFFRGTYLPAARVSVGILDTPRGAEHYQYLIEHFTTTKLTADEVHRIGLDEVERIRAEMQSVIERTGFQGNLAEFFEFLRSDPRFYYQTAQELVTACAVIAKKIDPELVRFFGKLPRVPYGVRPVPELLAPNKPVGYYHSPALDGSRPGIFYVNAHKPETRLKFETEALIAHEAVPGHHLQLALAQEHGEMPRFRRTASYGAYVEGWALYAESLGGELGLYADPYSKFGQLNYEMQRAVRLVVDTGMHAKRWTRAQAVDYMADNTGMTRADIVNEIDRYISLPGQALGYKIGELRIKALRERAGRELGTAFDIREFHDVVLGSGTVPLDVLERIVAEWLEARRRRPVN